MCRRQRCRKADGPANYSTHSCWRSKPQSARFAADLRHRLLVDDVNGPSGTGKTILLCDGIADAVVQHAVRPAEAASLRDLFTKSTTIGGLPVHPIQASLAGVISIVVASTNSAAVENITQMLHAGGRIANDNHAGAGYLASLLQTIS